MEQSFANHNTDRAAHHHPLLRHNLTGAWLSLRSVNSPGSSCFVGLYQADWIIKPHSHSPGSHMLWLDTLPGEIIKVGHHASDPLPRTNLGVAFDKESGSRDNKQQLLHRSCLNEVSLPRLRLARNSCRLIFCQKQGKGQKQEIRVSQ